MINIVTPLGQDIFMEREQLNRQIGISIRKYRLKSDISQENLGLSAGINPAYIGRLERGEKCPTIDTLYKICEALGISVCEILNFEGDSLNSETEAKLRIDKVLDKLPVQKQLKLAEIIESLVVMLDE